LIEYQGKIASFGTVMDIRALQAAKRIQTEFEEKLKLITDQPIPGILIIREGSIVYVNRGMAEILGCNAEEIMRWKTYDLCKILRYGNNENDDRTCFGKLMDFETDYSKYNETECSIVDCKGKEKWVAQFLRHIQFDSKPAIFLTLIDITGKKKAEEALKESEKKYRLLSENIPVVVYSAMPDRDAGTQFISGRIQVLTGYEAELFLTQPGMWKKIIHPEDLGTVMDNLIECRTGKKPLNIEYRILTKQNHIKWVSDKAEFTSDIVSGEERITGFIEDITAQVNADRQMEKLARELIRSNKELTQFAHTVSHDLQEPLRTITYFVEYLAEEYKGKLDEEADRIIERVIHNSFKMKNLIDDLLDFSRLGSDDSETEVLDIPEIIKETSLILHKAIEDNEAVIEYDEFPGIKANRVRIIRLFQNLLGNAIKFRGEAPPRISITCMPGGAYHQFCIKDNGIGISREFYQSIFIIFKRLHSNSGYTGTGIGLSVCKKIVEMYGGKIWVDSEPGKGSSFYFTLPAVINPEK
ncbi:MAG: ATP-binding protein, partial [Firmicutes bacterium]|nr:ATP-binding protein [Bacillota bacterium]